METATTYAIPDNPADPEAAALELIVRMPSDVLHTNALMEVLQDYCGVLHAERVFTGLVWDDAKAIAAAVSFDLCTCEDAADFTRKRARNVLAGTDTMPWRNREGAARAFNIAAEVRGLDG